MHFLQNNNKTTPLVCTQLSQKSFFFNKKTQSPVCWRPHPANSSVWHLLFLSLDNSTAIYGYVTANLCCNGLRIKCECGSIAMATSAKSLSYFHLLNAFFFLIPALHRNAMFHLYFSTRAVHGKLMCSETRVLTRDREAAGAARVLPSTRTRTTGRKEGRSMKGRVYFSKPWVYSFDDSNA